MTGQEVPMECYHEQLIQEHSLKLIAVEKELNYKKERLDSLKEDNIRMDKKLDEIKEIVNKMILTSKSDDESIKKAIEDNKKESQDIIDSLKLIINTQDNRITALETTNKTLKWGIGFGFSAIGTAIAILTFFITYIR